MVNKHPFSSFMAQIYNYFFINKLQKGKNVHLERFLTLPKSPAKLASLHKSKAKKY